VSASGAMSGPSGAGGVGLMGPRVQARSLSQEVSTEPSRPPRGGTRSKLGGCRGPSIHLTAVGHVYIRGVGTQVGQTK